jgi:uncharacterized SAM-binding protein YcdF (DUF218 family)
MVAILKVRWRSFVAIALVVTCVLLGSLYIARSPVLAWLGSLMVVADPIQAADAIVILDGSYFGEREIVATDLYKDGYAPRVIVTLGYEPQSSEILRQRSVMPASPKEFKLLLLRELGVPDDAIVVLEEGIESTFDEANLVADWVDGANIGSLILVTTRFHSARALYIFQRVFGDRNIRLTMYPTSVDYFNPDTWWRNRTTLRIGLFELQKLFFYRLIY